MKKLSPEEMKKITGGTKTETTLLFTYMVSAGVDPMSMLTDDYHISVSAMKGIFASKGYTFKPSESGQNLFEKDGLVYGQDYIEHLIKNGELF